MTKNNIGEAILIVGIMFCYLYFRPTSLILVAGMTALIIISVATWNTISTEIRDEGNKLEFEKTKLEIRKLEEEIKQMRNKK